MTTLTITDVSEGIISKSKYTAEELITVLFNYLDYQVDLESFSDKENKELLLSSNGNYEKLSKLID